MGLQNIDDDDDDSEIYRHESDGDIHVFFGRGDMGDGPGTAIARTTTSCWDFWPFSIA